MEEQKTKCNENEEEYTLLICLDSGEKDLVKLKDLPRTWPQGQFVSHRTGTFKEMDSLRRALISNNLKTLMRNA